MLSRTIGLPTEPPSALASCRLLLPPAYCARCLLLLAFDDFKAGNDFRRRS